MRKTKNIFTIIALGLLLTIKINAQQQGFIPAKDYGHYHNTVLKIYLDKNKGVNSSFENIYKAVAKEFHAKFPKVMSKNEENFYEERLKEHGSINTLNYKDRMKSAISKYYSKNISAQMLDIFNNNYKKDEINSKIDRLKTKNLTLKDHQDLDKFLITFNASVEFWSNRNGQANKQLRGCNPRHQVYLADAFGSLFGPLGTLGYSAFIEEAQSQHGGGCI